MYDAEEHGTPIECTNDAEEHGSDEQVCFIYLDAPEMEQQVSYVGSTVTGAASASAMSHDSEDWESVSQDMPTIRRGDTVLKYGPHKGMTYQQVLQKHPECLETALQRLEGKKTPKYIQHFVNWIQDDLPDGVRSRIHGARTRRSTMPHRLPQPCAAGCEEFTGRGSNYKVTMRTCLKCRHGTKVDKVETPVYSPETCPTMLLIGEVVKRTLS